MGTRSYLFLAMFYLRIVTLIGVVYGFFFQPMEKGFHTPTGHFMRTIILYILILFTAALMYWDIRSKIRKKNLGVAYKH